MSEAEKRALRERGRTKLAMLRAQLAKETDAARRGHLEYMIAELENTLQELG